MPLNIFVTLFRVFKLKNGTKYDVIIVYIFNSNCVHKTNLTCLQKHLQVFLDLFKCSDRVVFQQILVSYHVCRCPLATLHCKHRGVNGCAATINVFLVPNISLGLWLDRYYSSAGVRSVVDLYSIWEVCVSSIGFFFSVAHPLSVHGGTVSGFLLIHLSVSHFHYKTEWKRATAWITSPHLAFIHFPESSQGFSFSFCLSFSVRLCEDRMLEQIDCIGSADWGPYQYGLPFTTTHSLLLLPSPPSLLSQVVHAWLGKKPPLLSTEATCIWSSGLQKHNKDFLAVTLWWGHTMWLLACLTRIGYRSTFFL